MTAVPRGPSGCPHEAQKAPEASAPQRGHLVTRATGAPGEGPVGATGAVMFEGNGPAGPAEGRAIEGTNRVAAGFGRDASAAAGADAGGAAGAGRAGPATGGAAGGASTGCVPRGLPQAAQTFTPGSL
jgi:hypothetical protein